MLVILAAQAELGYYAHRNSSAAVAQPRLVSANLCGSE